MKLTASDLEKQHDKIVEDLWEWTNNINEFIARYLNIGDEVYFPERIDTILLDGESLFITHIERLSTSIFAIYDCDNYKYYLSDLEDSSRLKICKILEETYEKKN